jgi:hypothetical protein
LPTTEAVVLESARLTLHPLAVADAAEMAAVLADPELYRYTGGAPPTLEELTRRYERQVAGPAGSDETWLNWIVRRRDDGRAVGFLQATVHGSDADLARVRPSGGDATNRLRADGPGAQMWEPFHRLDRSVRWSNRYPMASMNESSRIC